MSIRITSVPRPHAPNSGFHPIKIAEKLQDEVWALPAKGRYLGTYKKVKFLLIETKLILNYLPPSVIRILAMLFIFFKALRRPEELFFVHSFIYSLPLFLARKDYVIVIHGSDARHLKSFIGRILARNSISLFGVGFKHFDKDFEVKEIPNIFDLQKVLIEKKSIKTYDIIFVLRNADVKNPTYPFNLFRNLLKGQSNIKIAVVGLGIDFLSSEEKKIIKDNNTSNSIDYFGRCSFEEVVDLMRASKHMILPSLSEGVAKAMLEAMACGLNIIISEKLNIPAVFKDNVIKIDLYNWGKIINIIESSALEEINNDNINFALNYHENSTNRLCNLYNSLVEIQRNKNLN